MNMSTAIEPISAEMKKPNSGVIVPHSPMDLLTVALQNSAGIDVIERLAALQEKALARDAEIQFNEAMNAVQAELGRIAPDLNNPQTKSKYASYAALDKIIRPLYTKNGFSLSFDTGDTTREETVRVLCYVSHRAGHTRRYQVDMPADGKGAKGGDVMTKTHATGAAIAYGSRYLLKSIFNVAVGEGDDDGNLTNGWLAEQLEWIANCKDPKELDRIFRNAFGEAKQAKASKAMLSIVEAKDKRKAELQ